MFRRTLLASVGAIALTGSAAFAADLPSRAPPPVYLPPPPIFTWTGLYLGLNAGGTWSNNSSVTTATADVFCNPALDYRHTIKQKLRSCEEPETKPGGTATAAPWHGLCAMNFGCPYSPQSLFRLQNPPILPRNNPRMPVPPRTSVHALQPRLMPPSPHPRNMRNNPSNPAK